MNKIIIASNNPGKLRELAALAVALVILPFYSPGVPSGGLLVMTPVYLALNLPVEGIGLLIAVDAIPDMFLTVANVTAVLTSATLLSRRVRSHEGIGDRGSGIRIPDR